MIPLSGSRQRALVGYLLLHRETPCERRHLAFLLWPSSTEEQALTNLRQLIHDVRAALPFSNRFIEAGRQLIRWRSDAPYALDLDQFERTIAEGMRPPARNGAGSAIATLSAAVSIYRGDLLPECYDDWVEPFRRRLQQVLIDALRRLVQLLEEQRAHQLAIPHAERLLALDPLDESATLTLMRLHAADGQRASALQSYQRCEELLRRELGITPPVALQEFRDRLLRAPAEREPLTASEPPPPAFVGRTLEWSTMMRAWHAAARGPPRCILISGVAGIGKTRLSSEFSSWADRQGAAIAKSSCYGNVGRLPYAPVVDWLRSPALRRSLTGLPDPWRVEISGLLPELSGPPSTRTAPGDASHPEARLRLFEALVRAVHAAPQPLVLILDDIQWADRETLEWLHFFLRGADQRWVLVLATLRSGELLLEERLNNVLLELRREGRLEEIALEPLDSADTAALAGAAAGEPLDPAEAQELHRETEGHPLYVVEMMRARGSGASPGAPRPSDASRPPSTGPSARHPLPQRILAVIRSRLAQVSPTALTVVEVASVIGRDFQIDLLVEGSGIGEAEVARALDELLGRCLVREQASGSYDFSHDSIREVAYAGLSFAHRRILHKRVARAQISSAGGSPGSASAIARHLEQAGFIEGAIPYHRAAAEHALSLYAGAEAVLHLERAIALLTQLPLSGGRRIQEIDLRTALCVALVNLEMFAGPRMLEEYVRVRALCDAAGVAPGPPALRTLAIALVMQGEMGEAAEIGGRLLAAVPPAGNPVLFVEAQYVLGVTAFWRGDPVAACGHLRAALATYRPDQAREHLSSFGQDAGVVCGVRLAHALWMIGQTGPAYQVLTEALARAEATAHPHTLAYARQFGAWALIDLGDTAAAGLQILGAIEVTTANDLPGWPIRNRALHGFLLADAGQVDSGISMMRTAAEEWAKRGWRLAVPYDRSLLARTYLRAGRLEEAFRTLEEGVAVARETGQCFWDSELLRLRSELLTASGAPASEIRRVLQQALDVAAAQGATALVRRVEERLQHL